MPCNITALVLPCVLLVLVLSSTLSFATIYNFNVVSYGASPDGKTDSTKAFSAAWTQACGAKTSGVTINVPKGRFLLKNILFFGPCKPNNIVFLIEGTLVAPSNYYVIGNVDHWINFNRVDGLTISGGTLDGQGNGLWACKTSGKNNCPLGATNLAIANSNNVMIKGLTSLNSQMFHMVINGCQNLKIQGVKVVAPGNSPNTDGINVQFSTSVSIVNSQIATGDDCISIGRGTSNVWIENIMCGPGHGISIGSLGKDLQEAGVQNVTVKTATFVGTTNGVRIKSWGRASNGYARNILFEDCTMRNVQNPIMIDQNYCPGNINCPGQVSGVKISDVTYQNIYGTSATPVAVTLDCSKKFPCRGIKMENVKLTYNNGAAQAACDNIADGSTSGFVQPDTCL